MVPPAPPVLAPVPSKILPLLPSFDTPELKTNRPLAPAAPAFILTIETDPLLVAVPSPPTMFISPPVRVAPVPAENLRSPPAPLVPLPTLTRIAPDAPPVDDPVPQMQAPLFPVRAVPELNIIQPLQPATPALDVLNATVPLLVAVPSAP